MQLTQSTSMRQEMEQRQLLTPRMIQSMEILQLPLLALEERIEQEMQSNPVLELRDGDPDVAMPVAEELSQGGDNNHSEAEQPMVVKENTDQAEDFDRLAKMSEYLENED